MKLPFGAQTAPHLWKPALQAKPHPPASQTNIEKEEAQTIGTGSWNGTNPTENSMRSELGEPRRDNRYGSTNDAAGNPQTTPSANNRPGGY